MKIKTLALVVVCLSSAGNAQNVTPALATGVGQAGQGTATKPRPPRYVEPKPSNFNDHEGWQSMFDGKSFVGWEGQLDAWRIEDGAIVSSETATNSTANGSVYLFWKGNDGGDLADFEFKTEIKLEGEKANSGVQFRAMLLGKTEKKNSEWESFGYQGDMDFTNVQTGALIECCAGPRRGPSPRPFRASMGMALRTGAGAADTPALIGSVGDVSTLKASIHTGDWNQLHIIARGHTLAYFLNGKLMSFVIDDDPVRFIPRGRLAIQLEGSGDRRVSYRNLWLRKLN